MEITYFHKNLSKDEEKEFFDYLSQKTSAIENLLTKFADDAKVLRVSIEKFEKHTAFEVEMQLSLPAKNLVAKEASHHITKAVDLSKDRLINQLKKHLAMLRKDRSHKSIRKNNVEATNLITHEQ